MIFHDILLYGTRVKAKESLQNGGQRVILERSSSEICSNLCCVILFVSPRHAMVKLADAIDWQSFEDGLSASFSADNGRTSPSAQFV